MKSEKDKMLAGQLYDSTDAHLAAERQRARKLCKALNDSRHEEQELRARIIRELFARTGEAIWIERPFTATMAATLRSGTRYFNFNCVVLDPGSSSIGSNPSWGDNHDRNSPWQSKVTRERARCCRRYHLIPGRSAIAQLIFTLPVRIALAYDK